MGIKSWFSSSNKNKDDNSINNITEENVLEGLSFEKHSSNSEKLKSFIVKAVGFLNQETYRRENFKRPEYNLLEIKEAAEADSYIKIAFSKYSYLLYKEGYQLKSENQQAIDYLQKRFKIMTFATGKPMEILFQEIGDDLVKYSNAFLIKSRVDNIPTVKAIGVFDENPVGGYFRVDPATIKIKRDKNGNVLKYEQGIGLNKKQFKVEDVIHMYYDKDANNAFGTPRIIAALDDVKLLRKIEGNVVALIHRFAMPLYQWKIGQCIAGFQASQAEIDKAKREIESSSLDGLLITNEKSEIKAIGAEGNALDAKPYLEYFENRAFSALELSASQMGRGGAKQDADSMEAQIHNTVKYLQRIISIWIENTMISELLLEGGFDVFDPYNEVKYVFNEISIETKIKKENHEMLKWQSNGITNEEFRRELGMREIKEEERLYDRMIKDHSTISQIDRNGEWQIELAKTNAKLNPTTTSTSSSNSSSSKTKSISTNSKKIRNTSGKKEPNKAVTNNNRPTNQHGTTSVKVKENELDYYKQIIINSSHKNIEYNTYNATIDSTVAISEYLNDFKLIPNKIVKYDYFYELIDKKINDILQEAIQNSNNNDDNILLDSYIEKINNLNENISSMAYLYSYIKNSSLNNIKEAFLYNKQTNEYETINTETFNYEDILKYDLQNSSVVYERGE